MAKIIDFTRAKRKQQLDALERQHTDSTLFRAYMNSIFSNDDGLNAQIDMDIEQSKQPRGHNATISA